MLDNLPVFARYIITLRIIQPARVQDILAAYKDMWEEKDEDKAKNTVYAIHHKMRSDGYIKDSRKGSYILDDKGMEIASKFVKDRDLDNRRLFLMKRQRRLYS
ncbi:hypothetical protein AB9E29_04735 [Rhizobium leguminosarum]|uniref:hypothetical protein n=1 Tax=Rhizobium leguminosarum TaxID=384 RepID=UPI003F981443